LNSEEETTQAKEKRLGYLTGFLGVSAFSGCFFLIILACQFVLPENLSLVWVILILVVSVCLSSGLAGIILGNHLVKDRALMVDVFVSVFLGTVTGALVSLILAIFVDTSLLPNFEITTTILGFLAAIYYLANFPLEDYIDEDPLNLKPIG
jgi:hypothetical protein